MKVDPPRFLLSLKVHPLRFVINLKVDPLRLMLNFKVDPLWLILSLKVDPLMVMIMGFLFPILKKMFPPLQLIIRCVPFVVITSGSYLLNYHQDWIAQTSIKFKSQLRLN